MNPDHSKALNQLLSVLVGAGMARATNDLSHAPSERIEECLKLTLQELGQAAMDGDTKAQKQATRKMESLQSLRTIAASL